MSEAQKSTRVITGRVASARMDKSIVVLVERRVRHPIYDKYMRRSTRITAHAENNEASAGDLVEISECRPISKRKTWRLVRVVETAGEFETAG